MAASIMRSSGKFLAVELEGDHPARDGRNASRLAGKTVVLILGMHRSGTSLAAHAFAAAGLPLGERLLVEPRPDNPDGYWEDADIVATQESLLVARFGGIGKVWSAEGLDDVDGPACPGVARAAALARLKEIVADRLSRSPVFAIKDPRTARLLPLWLALSRETGLRLVAVLAIRHPGEVARSLEARDGLPRGLGEIMWLRSVADVLAHSGTVHGIPLLSTIVYDSWFAPHGSNRQVIDKLAASLGLETRAGWIAPVQARHRHQDESSVVLPVTREVYHAIAGFGAGVIDDATRRLLLYRIEGLVTCFGGWPALARNVASASPASKLRSAFLPLPADASSETGEAAEWQSAGRVVLKHGNQWCRLGQGGYLLHANAPGEPSAALEWQGVFSSRPTVLRGLVGAGSTPMSVTLEISCATGTSPDPRSCLLAPWERWEIAVPLPIQQWNTIRLSAAPAPAATDAYGAGLTVFGMKME